MPSNTRSRLPRRLPASPRPSPVAAPLLFLTLAVVPAGALPAARAGEPANADRAALAPRSVAGRVKSGASGLYLRNARVAVEGTTVEVLTDEAGEFLLPARSAAPRLRS